MSVAQVSLSLKAKEPKGLMVEVCGGGRGRWGVLALKEGEQEAKEVNLSFAFFLFKPY